MGVVAACQSERSQHRIRVTAQSRLAAKLYQMEQAKRESIDTAYFRTDRFEVMAATRMSRPS